MFFSSTNCTLSLLGVFRLQRGESRSVSHNNRSYDSISIRKVGSAQFACAGRTYQVNTGALLYIPEKAHYTQQTQGEIIYAVHFVNYSAHATTLELMMPEDPEKALYFMEQMWQEWESKKIGYQYRCTAMLYSLLELSCRQRFTEQIQTVASESRLTGAVNYMYKHYRRSSLTVSELAAQSHYSEVYFRELFIQLFGIPPKRYIQNLRLEYAEQLLRSQLYSVQQVAQMSGFDNPKYFSDAFRKKYGCTPRDFRRGNR